MAPLKSLFALGCLTAVSAFTTPEPLRKPIVPSTQLLQSDSPYSQAQATWEKDWKYFAEYGWGPSVLAEVWNGRHAMFGWFFIICTAYAQGHGLIENAATHLKLSEWGPLATIGMQGLKSPDLTITQERAVILIANVHFFGVSLMSTIAPLPFGDTLLLDDTHPSYERMKARNENPFGYFPEFKTGLTEEAELLNGRMAMLGLVVLLFATAIEQKSILDIVNEWTGNVLIA